MAGSYVGLAGPAHADQVFNATLGTSRSWCSLILGFRASAASIRLQYEQDVRDANTCGQLSHSHGVKKPGDPTYVPPTWLYS